MSKRDDRLMNDTRKFRYAYLRSHCTLHKRMLRLELLRLKRKIDLFPFARICCINDAVQTLPIPSSARLATEGEGLAHFLTKQHGEEAALPRSFPAK